MRGRWVSRRDRHQRFELFSAPLDSLISTCLHQADWYLSVRAFTAMQKWSPSNPDVCQFNDSPQHGVWDETRWDVFFFEELPLLWKANDKTVNIWFSRSSNSRWSFLLILPLVLHRTSIFLPRTTSWVVTTNTSDVPLLRVVDDNNVKTVCRHKRE